MKVIDKIIKGFMLSEIDNKDLINYIQKWITDNNVHDVKIIILQSLWDDIVVDIYYDDNYDIEEFKSIFTIISDNQFYKISEKYKSILEPIIFDNYINSEILSVGLGILGYGSLGFNKEMDDEYPYWLILKIN